MWRHPWLGERAVLAASPPQVIAEVNGFLRGWAGYYRYGNSARHFEKVHGFSLRRLARYVRYRHKRGFGYGWAQVAYLSPDNMGIISLNGIVVAPRSNKPWRAKLKATR